MRHIVLVVLAFWSCVYASSLKVAVPEDVWLDYLALVDGREPLSIVDYRSAHARRDTVELLLLQQALAEGGWQGELDWQVINSYERILLELSVAGVDVGATSMWVSDLLASGLSWSLPLIEDGEFMVGLYAHESRQDLLSAEWAVVRQQTAITNAAWQTDMELLRSLGVERVLSNPSYATQMRMLALGRADFRLLSFRPNADMVAEQDGERFLPILGLKVAMPGRRALAFAASEEALAALAAFNQGLAILRLQGRVESAYLAAGFFQPLVSDWRVVNP